MVNLPSARATLLYTVPDGTCTALTVEACECFVFGILKMIPGNTGTGYLGVNQKNTKHTKNRKQ